MLDVFLWILFLTISGSLLGDYVLGTDIYKYSYIIVGSIIVVFTPVVYMETSSPFYSFITVSSGVLAIAAGYTQYRTDSLDSLRSINIGSFTAFTAYGLLTMVPQVREFFIESVATHSALVLRNRYTASIESGPLFGYNSELVFTGFDPVYATYIEPACTGVTSIAFVIGLISILDISSQQKVLYGILSFGIIYILNIIRNVFVAAAFAEQWFSHPLLIQILGKGQLTSFVIADTYIGQIVSAILLVIVLLGIARYTTELDELLESVEKDLSNILRLLKQPY